LNKTDFIDVILKNSNLNFDIDKLELYKKLILEENKKYNLTSFTDEEMYEKFFLNSIYPYLFIN
jgi:16S rRNA G527 N7-methylase RsmG